MTATAWRTSTRSISGNCVEVGQGRNQVLVRDSAQPDVLTFAIDAHLWRQFTGTLKQP